jgi:hypothetical protein
MEMKYLEHPLCGVCPQRTGKNRHSIDRYNDKSIFMVSYAARLYEEVLSTIASYKTLGIQIIEQIRVADVFHRIVLSSPFAYAYPEGQGTATDLRGPHKSTVAINPSQYTHGNVVVIPAAEHRESTARQDEPARALDLEEWEKKMVNGKKENGDEQKHVEGMNASDMLLRAWHVFSDRSIPEEKRREMIRDVERILAEPIKLEADKPEAGSIAEAKVLRYARRE